MLLQIFLLSKLLNKVVFSRLYIEQPQSSTSISGHDEEAEWAEYKIKETNMFTVDKYQQVSFSNHSPIQNQPFFILLLSYPSF